VRTLQWRFDLCEQLEDSAKLFAIDASARILDSHDRLLAFWFNREPNATSVVGELQALFRRLPTA